MSSKTNIQHLYNMKIVVEGLDPERTAIIFQTATKMGAKYVELNPEEYGTIVVTSR
jgi:hypothetical protein